MTLSEIKLRVPILFGSRIIYITDYTYGINFGYAHYISGKDWLKYESFYLVPESSIRDKTYRSRAERYNIVAPEKKYLELSKKNLAQMKFV